MKNALILLLATVGAIALLGCEGKPDTTKPAAASSATPANAAPAGSAAPAPTGGW